MTFTLQLELGDLLHQQLIDEIKIGCQAAMANRFASVVHNNFGGFGGEDRPFPWQSLSRGYADEFHGGSRLATLELTGALRESIQIDDTSYEAAKVWTDNEYAFDQQNGNSETRLPARPFFPMVGDSFAPYTESECIAAAQAELERILNRN